MQAVHHLAPVRLAVFGIKAKWYSDKTEYPLQIAQNYHVRWSASSEFIAKRKNLAVQSDSQAGLYQMFSSTKEVNMPLETAPTLVAWT